MVTQHALKYHQHGKSEGTVVPVIIERPEDETNNLEHKERRDKMLDIQIKECRYWDLNNILKAV